MKSFFCTHGVSDCSVREEAQTKHGNAANILAQAALARWAGEPCGACPSCIAGGVCVFTLRARDEQQVMQKRDFDLLPSSKWDDIRDRLNSISASLREHWKADLLWLIFLALVLLAWGLLSK